MTAEIVRTSGHLTISPDQTFWTEDQALVLQQAGIGEDVTKAELTGFLHLSQRTGLDPFSRQIYLIGRWDPRAQRKVYTPQTAIDGYRVVRDRVIERTNGTLSYDDFLWCGPDGTWQDVWLDDTTPPVAAKVTVYRNGGRFSAVAKYTEYVQTKKGGEPTGMWVKMPASQLAKCAEALALRKAFPHDLAGVYTAEEMAQADNLRVEQAPAEDFGQRPAQRETPTVPADDQWTVVPSTVVSAPPAPPMATKGQLTHLTMSFAEMGITDRNTRLRHASQLLGREVTSFTTLTAADYQRLSKALRGGWPLIDPVQGPGPAPGEYAADPEQLEENPVRDILADGIKAANSPATLNAAGKDIADELLRESITPDEAKHLRGLWTARRDALAELAAMHQEEAGLMAMAGADGAA